ncbi:Transcriptional regulator, IclR family [Nostocoides australiense Ben110]|uniref:Transcriptional regulator, IclR family n=1 Tax=Nostocoides australiense Ben110 TaxID=1193182 RepID=W6JXB1_9MICO|nr:IclR family transcriptional regulator [Tetrasphaera australiensis]CCH74213.1 Transcriptional regulator, IclR family [Tetrasphaera australiensis Ben110]
MRSTDRNTARDARELGNRTVLHRILAVLGAFDTSTTRLGLAELCRRAGLPKTTVHRIAGELVEERLLVRDEQGLYALGMRLFEIGELVPVHRTLSSVALPIMEDLREATRKRVHLAVLDGIDVVYVEILGATSIDVGSRPGGRIPAHATGVGKVILAYSPTATIQARLEAGLPALTPRTITTKDALVADLRKIRSIGMSLDLEESHLGVSCVAAPVFGFNKRIRAGLSITGPIGSMDPGLLGPAVRTAAFTLSRALRDAGL